MRINAIYEAIQSKIESHVFFNDFGIQLVNRQFDPDPSKPYVEVLIPSVEGTREETGSGSKQDYIKFEGQIQLVLAAPLESGSQNLCLICDELISLLAYTEVVMSDGKRIETEGFNVAPVDYDQMFFTALIQIDFYTYKD